MTNPVPLPPPYHWLQRLDGLPKTIIEGLKLHGTKEFAGAANNPEIMAWAQECGIHYPGDSVPWCGLFAAVVAKRAGKKVPAGPLWARGWVNFGKPQAEPGLGDVLVFSRGAKSGHVGFYVAEDDTCFHVLGGNQGDAVSIVRIEKARLIGARRPVWSVAQPAAVKPYRVAPTGLPSTNEA